MFEHQETEYRALASWLNTRLESWRRHRDTNQRQKWEEFNRIWRGIWASSDTERKSERSKIVTPATQQAVDATVAELEEATFGRGKWFDIQDDYLDQDRADAEFNRNLLQEDMEKDGVKESICEGFTLGGVYGTNIGKLIVEQTVERVPVELPVEGTLTTMRQLMEMPGIKIKLDPIDPRHFIPDPSVDNIDDGLGVAHDMIKPRYHVVEGIQAGIYRDVPINGDYDVKDLGLNEETRMADESDSVKITEYWGKVPKKFLKPKVDKDDFEYDKKNELVEAVVTILNDEYILRAEENAFMMKDRPFVAAPHEKIPGSFWGRGVVEKGYNAQKALDTEMRARIDSLALTTIPMMAADATRLPRGVKFEVRPGKTVLTNGSPREAIMPLDMGTTDPQTINQINLLQGMIQMGTGTMDNVAADRSTSAGMSMAQSAAIKRQKRVLMNFQNTYLIPLINKIMWRRIQFDVERYPVTDYKYVPYSTMGIMAKELEMQQLVQVLQSMPKDSPAFSVILTTMLQNSSIHNRDQIVDALMQAQQPNPEQAQLQQMGVQLQIQQAQAEIQKTLAEAEEEKAKAIKWQAEAAEKQPNEIDIQEKVLKLQKESINLERAKADIANKNSETARNIPEVEHLRSETALNLAKARETNAKIDIQTIVQ